MMFASIKDRQEKMKWARKVLGISDSCVGVTFQTTNDEEIRQLFGYYAYVSSTIPQHIITTNSRVELFRSFSLSSPDPAWCALDIVKVRVSEDGVCYMSMDSANQRENVECFFDLILRPNYWKLVKVAA